MDNVFEIAMQNANKKLSSIIAREGDANGARRDEGYLNILIGEELKVLLISEKSIELFLKKKNPQQPIKQPSRIFNERII